MKPQKLKISISKNTNPHTIALCALLFFSLLYITSPLNITYISSSALLLALAGIIFISSSYLGCALKKTNRPEPYFTNYSPRIKKLFIFCFYLSLLGALLRFYDFFFLRGHNFSEGLASVRIAAQSLTYSEHTDLSQAGILSAIGAIFFGFTYPLAVILVIFYQSIPTTQRKIGVFLSITPIIDSLLNAGIMGAAFTALYIGFAIIYKFHITGIKLNTKLVFYTIAAVIVLFWLGAFNYKARIELMFGDAHTFLNMTNTLTKPTPFLYDIFDTPILGSIAFSYYWFSSYLLQGIAEFAYLVDHFDTNSLLYGGKQLFVIDKFFSIIGITSFDAYQLTAINPRPGRYQTAFGDIYMDFGIIGILLQPLIAGLIFSYAYISRGRGKLWALILYPFFQASILSGFLINTLSGGRFYFLAAGIIAVAFYYLSFGSKKRKTF